MNRSKLHFRHVLLYHFDQGKNAAEACRLLVETYGEFAPSESTCRAWFQRFKSGDCDVEDKERSGRPKKFEDTELQALLDEDAAQTLKQLSHALGVSISTVSDRLHAMGKIQKYGKWVPYELSPEAISNRLNISISLLERYKKKSFLWRIVTGDEKWIYFDNPKRETFWVDPGQSVPSTSKRDIHAQKVMLCIWWDEEGVAYYELLKPGETVNKERYQQQLIKLNEELLKKRSAIASNRRKVILLHDNTRPHVAQVVKETLKDIGWEVLPHPAYSPDLAPSDYHLFRSMQNALEDTQFKTYGEVRKWVDSFIAGKSALFFRRGIQLLPWKWQKCVESEGRYFD